MSTSYRFWGKYILGTYYRENSCNAIFLYDTNYIYLRRWLCFEVFTLEHILNVNTQRERCVEAYPSLNVLHNNWKADWWCSVRKRTSRIYYIINKKIKLVIVLAVFPLTNTHIYSVYLYSFEFGLGIKETIHSSHNLIELITFTIRYLCVVNVILIYDIVLNTLIELRGLSFISVICWFFDDFFVTFF